MTRADRLAEAVKRLLEANRRVEIHATEQKRRARRLVETALDRYRSAPVDIERCARAIKAIPKTDCYPLSYQERLLVARTVLREAGVVDG